ncbi:MAG: septum formation protein Maf [Bacteroidetes bacterium]|nr:septum formation protein Maf [Bacteroidota bacterium]
MLSNKLKKYHIILASKSPRRKFLLKELGLDFEIRTKDVDESFPQKLKGKQIAFYLCKKKAEAFKDELKKNDLLITADTIVWIKNKVLNKPANYSEAVQMLKLLSGKMHVVYTGVSLTTNQKQKIFCVATKVFFKKLSEKEIHFYVSNYKPFDKAGAYGAQEWIGYVGVKKIIGSYFNVMGLPVKELYEELMKFQSC